MEVTQHNIRCVLWRFHDFPSHLLPHGHLCRMGKQSTMLVAQRQTRINDDPAVLDLHLTRKAAYAL